MQVQNYEFQASKQFTGANTWCTDWLEVDDVYELMAFLKIIAKGGYTDEALNIQVQTMTPSPDFDALDLKDVKFIEVTNPSIPYLDYLSFANFGSKIRFKIVTTGSSPDYTLKISGYGKR